MWLRYLSSLLIISSLKPCFAQIFNLTNDPAWEFFIAPPNNRSCDQIGNSTDNLLFWVAAPLRHVPKCYNFQALFNGTIPWANNASHDIFTFQNENNQNIYDTAANYSDVSFHAGGSSGANLTELKLTMYQSSDCSYNNATNLPWFEWGGCGKVQERRCKQLPYSLGSFKVEMGDSTTCLVGSQLGTGKSAATRVGAYGSLAAILGALVACLLML